VALLPVLLGGGGGVSGVDMVMLLETSLHGPSAVIKNHYSIPQLGKKSRKLGILG
jgi:hypothetical protein